jgi:signal transduction histidine kinase
MTARANIAGPPEVRAVAATFNEMADRLAELLMAQRRFVADASHQLRSPLTALRLRLENLQSGMDPAAAIGLEAASDEVSRLSRIIDGLLTLSRAEGTRAQREVVNVAAVVEERCQAWSALAEERSVRLDAAINGLSGARAMAVPGDLDQILDNLLANALDATPEGGAITMSLTRQGGQVAVHVTDNGPGMSAEERARAFDRFWRGSGLSNGHSGLGLAIVQQLATASGGQVSLDQSEGGGLDAGVTLEGA